MTTTIRRLDGRRREPGFLDAEEDMPPLLCRRVEVFASQTRAMADFDGSASPNAGSSSVGCLSP
jgi:hypothetical protein